MVGGNLAIRIVSPFVPYVILDEDGIISKESYIDLEDMSLHANLSGIDSGKYNILVKPNGYLARVIKNVDLTKNDTDFGEFCPGDFNDDNKVNSQDIGPLSKAFGSISGETYHNKYVDINLDGKVDIFDVASFENCYGKKGEEL